MVANGRAAHPGADDAGAAAGRRERGARSGAPAGERADAADSDRRSWDARRRRGTCSIELADTLQAPVDVDGLRVVAEVPVVASALRHRRAAATRRT